MTYQSIYEFTATTNTSKSTIIRFYQRNPDLFAETKKKRMRMYPLEHARYFDSKIMFDENKNLREQNKQLSNLIECLSDKNSLQTRLWYMDWTFFCTVAYKAERNQRSCYKQMTNLHNHLEAKFTHSDFRMFFTTEKFTNRQGYHNHFILHVSDVEVRKKITKEIQDFFQYDITDIKSYDRMKAGLFYTSKNGLSGEDWDLLGNNLSDDKQDSNG
jgi:ribosomal protein L23